MTIEVDVVEETDNITLHSRGLTLGPALLTRQVRLALSNRKLTRVKVTYIVESSGEVGYVSSSLTLTEKHKLRNRTKFL